MTFKHGSARAHRLMMIDYVMVCATGASIFLQIFTETIQSICQDQHRDPLRRRCYLNQGTVPPLLASLGARKATSPRLSQPSVPKTYYPSVKSLLWLLFERIPVSDCQLGAKDQSSSWCWLTQRDQKRFSPNESFRLLQHSNTPSSNETDLTSANRNTKKDSWHTARWTFPDRRFCVMSAIPSALVLVSEGTLSRTKHVEMYSRARRDRSSCRSSCTPAIKWLITRTDLQMHLILERVEGYLTRAMRTEKVVKEERDAGGAVPPNKRGDALKHQIHRRR